MEFDYVKTKVGDKYVYEEWKSTDTARRRAVGHIIFSKYANTGDGILTSLKLVQVMLDKKKKLSELSKPVRIYPQVLKNIKVKDKEAAQNDPEVKAAVEKVAAQLGVLDGFCCGKAGRNR